MNQRWLRYKRPLRWLSGCLLLCAVALWLCNAWVVRSTKSQLFSRVADVPSHKVGLVLGASKNTARGTTNQYFAFRMQAAYELYRSGKVQYLLLSGDNHTEGYDEPSDMREALIQLGVPDSCLVLDYAGFRTLDSVLRCRDVFGEDSITIISQEFHNQRALFIANKRGVHAVAYNAPEVSRNYSLKTRIREYFARVKCVLDLYVLHIGPKFLGEKIHIGH